MTIKQNQLKEIIKQVVRESLNEKNQLPSEKIPAGKLAHLNPNLAKPSGKSKMNLPPKKVNEAGLTSEKDDKWIQKAVDPKHKGYCTPMTKSTCTPHRKALAQRFKKHQLQEELELYRKTYGI